MNQSVMMVVEEEELEQQLQRIGKDEFVINVDSSGDRKLTHFVSPHHRHMHKTLNNGHVLRTWKEHKRKTLLGKIAVLRIWMCKYKQNKTNKSKRSRKKEEENIPC